jgi:DsbC/DsbD-like thiol-disulfide interchange protein
MNRSTVTRTAWTVLSVAGVLGWLFLSAGPARVAAQGSAEKSDAHVKVAAMAEKPDANGKQVIAVTLEMDNGWHIYANPVEHEFVEKEATKVKASIDGKPVDLKVDYPKGKVIEDDGGNYRVYEKKVTITATLQRTKGDNRPLKVTVGFQACNDAKKKCLTHADVEREIP